MKIQKIIRRGVFATVLLEDAGKIAEKRFPASMSDGEIEAAVMPKPVQKAARTKTRRCRNA